MADKALNNLRNEGLDGIGGDADKLKKTLSTVLNSSSTEKLALGKPFNQTDLANYQMFTEAAERLGTDKMSDGEIQYYRMAKEISNYSSMSPQQQAVIRQKAAEVSADYWGTGSTENQKMIKGNIVTELGVAGTAVDYSNGSATKGSNKSPVKAVAGQGNAGMTLEQGYKAGRDAIIKNSGKDVAAGQKREYEDSLASTADMAAASNFNAYNININEFDTSQLYRVFGMPYQWMDIADRRIPGTDIGRTFGAKIASKIPLLIMTPGLPEFLAGYSSKEKNALIQKLSGGADGISLQSLADGIVGKGKETKYYQLRFAKKEYFTYVNAMTNALAAYLGISDEDSPYGGKIGNFDWSTLTSTSSLSKQLSYYGAVAFYLNSETSISESFSNDTTQSQLASKVNEMSGMVRELQFITGLTNISFYDNANTSSGNVINNTASDSKNAGDSMFGSFGTFIDNLKTGAKTVFAGGKLVFPEIWSDSSHSVSYTVNLKLTTPDFDKYSWFLNIGAPLIHLICMSAPRQMGANGYASPFLVRAFYKGFFSIDSGMIGSLSITKGTDGGWTIDGLPTVVDVSMDIKDLYHSMNIIAPDVIGDLSGNLSMESSLKNVNALTYLANMAGVNINQTDIGRAFRLSYWSIKGQAKQLLSNGPMQALTQTVMNRIMHMYN